VAAGLAVPGLLVPSHLYRFGSLIMIGASMMMAVVAYWKVAIPG